MSVQITGGGLPPRVLLSAVPNILVVQDRGEKQVKDYHDRKAVGGDVERRHERLAGIVDNCPVKRNRQETQPRAHAKDCVDLLIVRPDPGDKSERRQACGNVVREPERDEGEKGEVAEESVP